MKKILLPPHHIAAIQAGTKTQLRFPMEIQPGECLPDKEFHSLRRCHPYVDSYCSEKKTPENPRGMSEFYCWWMPDNRQGQDWIECPFWRPGTKLGVFPLVPVLLEGRPKLLKKEPTLTLLIQNIRVERLHDISPDDLIAEGISAVRGSRYPTMAGPSEEMPCVGASQAQKNFQDEWARQWEPAYLWTSNPFVWVLEIAISQR